MCMCMCMCGAVMCCMRDRTALKSFKFLTSKASSDVLPHAVAFIIYLFVEDLIGNTNIQCCDA